MKAAAVVCNVALFAFTCVVLLVDGAPTELIYIVFTLWLLFTLVLTAVVISRSTAGHAWNGRESLQRHNIPTSRLAAIACNIVLFGFTLWAFLEQYPHPQEPGFVAFMVLIFTTPILSLVVLFGRRTDTAGASRSV